MFADVEKKCKLPQLRLCQVEVALNRFDLDLKGLRQKHVRNDEKRYEAQVREEERILRREARQERMRLRNASATKIQALVRSFFVRRHVLPSVLERKRIEELEGSRIALADSMLGLHQNIHDLAFLDEDRYREATRIQAWWRGVHARRIVQIVKLRNRLATLHRNLSKAATKLQTITRGRQARRGCMRLRLERERQKLQAERAANDKMMKAVIKIQSHVRRRAAIKYTTARKAEMAKELEGGREGHSTATPKEHSHEPRHRPAPANRKKRNAAETHGAHGGGATGGTQKRSGHHENSHENKERTELTAPTEHDIESPRRRSYTAVHSHKPKKHTSKKLNAAFQEVK